MIALTTRSVLASLIATVCGGCFGHLETRASPLELHTEAPSFSLTAHNGRTLSLSALLKRGPVVVVFYRGAW